MKAYRILISICVLGFLVVAYLAAQEQGGWVNLFKALAPAEIVMGGILIGLILLFITTIFIDLYNKLK